MRRRVVVPIMVGLLLAVMGIAGAACDGDEEVENGSPPPTEVAPEATPEPSPAATPEPTPGNGEETDGEADGDAEAAAETTATVVAPVTYTVADREDVSTGAVVRILYRVGVGRPLTEETLRRIAQEIIDDETAEGDVNAIRFFFYLPGTDVTGTYTAGKADWAPEGDWASADTVEAGDYSRHELGAIDIVSP